MIRLAQPTETQNVAGRNQACCTHHSSRRVAYDVKDAATLCGVEPGLLRAQIWHCLLEARYPTSRPVIQAEELGRWHAAYMDVIKPFLESPERRNIMTATGEASQLQLLVGLRSTTAQEKTCCACHAIKKIAYTYEEAGEAIGVSTATIRRLVKENYLIAKYPTSKPVIPVSELETFIDSCPDEPRR